ncbi:MAG: hypothetical protein J1D88_08890 [Treponema sp.]|nr:hypothetical protein [Treponema sp.]
MKKFFGWGVSALFMALAFAGCASSSLFTNFVAANARSILTSYDMQIVSTDDTICKVYKLTEKPGGTIFYAISDTDWTSDSMNVEELSRFVVITKENAEALAAFIDQLQTSYRKEARSGNGSEGVLYDIAIVRDYTYHAMTVDSITQANSFTTSGVTGTANTGYQSAYGNAVTKSMKEFSEEDELVRIQLKTTKRGDAIIFAVAGYEESVTLDEMLAFKHAISQ